MTPGVLLREEVAAMITSSLCMALATSQAAVRVGGKVNTEFLHGVFSAQRSLAQAASLSWPEIVHKALCDFDVSETRSTAQRLAGRSLPLLVSGIEKELLVG
jgi:hypothetical protein